MTNRELIIELQQKRRELNRQIRELRNSGEVSVDGARISRVQRPGAEVWSVSLEVAMDHSYRNQGTQFKALYKGARHDCIEAIPSIIGKLEELYRAANGAETGQSAECRVESADERV